VRAPTEAKDVTSGAEGLAASGGEAKLTRNYRKLSVRTTTELANNLNKVDGATPVD
jgi:hypothetical protein